MKYLLSILCIATLSLHAGSAKKEPVKFDKDTGLKIAKGVETVKANCTACHSAKFIILQKGDRDTWLSMIRWMQKTQGLWKFDAKTEDTILTYLETNYPPGKASRRANLKLSDMPQ